MAHESPIAPPPLPRIHGPTLGRFQVVTLPVTVLPGDVILTGTPPGVGCFRKPPLFLKPGDVVTCEIDGIGAITNTVVAEE